MEKHLKFQCWFSLAWVIFICVKMRGMWSATSWFLFKANDYDPRALPAFDTHDVWHASHGTWHLLALLIFASVLVRASWLLSRGRSALDEQRNG